MLAFAMMAVIHRHANKTPPPKTKVRAKASSGKPDSDVADWRRAHQAAAQHAHIKLNTQL
jgi:hypothetical protein